jgi:DNA-binding winged helix-turn-helix (wHTH) protein/tetratricopeptide (TPR) repeat protein
MVLHRLGPFRLDSQDNLLLRGSDPVALGRRAIALLRALVERPGAVVSKDALITAAWHHRAVEESNLTVQIAALRRALGEAPGGDSWIETVPRHGYRFVGPVVREDPDEAMEGPPQVDATPSTLSMPRDGAERRQVTAMSCELIGLPKRAHTNDHLEEWLESVDAFRRCVSTTADRHKGFITTQAGNATLVLFGYPAAHEHDAEQAVLAGLELSAAVRTLEPPAKIPMRCRVGISTGMVIIGNFIGLAEHRNLEIVGDTPEQAARLQMSAEPDTVVVEGVTRHLLGNLFECHEQDPITLGRDAEPIRRWRVRGESKGASRFEARRGVALSPLVGRQEEMELLLRRWGQAKLGEGRVVLLSGEPGIGKSRIADNLLTKVESEPHARLRYFCSPHHTHSSLYPVIAQLEKAASFELGSSVEAKLDKLEALLKPTAHSVARDVALVADLLSVPTEGFYPALTITPQQRREMTLMALLDQLEGTAAKGPVLIVFEDVHWIDPTSLDLLDRTIARIANLPALLVITFRPEFQPTWVGQPHVRTMPLSRLGRCESVDLMGGVAKGKALPDPLVEQVLARADGVPLFIEELTSTLLEGGLLRETAESYVLDGPLPFLAIPTTLQASLVSRLDRLGPVKDVAQIGAAIGREFPYDLLGAVASLAPADLDTALEQLTASGLVSRRGAPPVATYSFKHALVQDAAYDTLLKSRRRQLHASIAHAIVDQFPETVARLPQVVAHHFTQAGLASEAIGYWRKAGQLAIARSAGSEALKFFEQALHLLIAQPQTPERLQQAIDLHFDLRAALVLLGEFERIFSHLQEAEGLARKLGDQRRLGEISVYMCQSLWTAGRHREALTFGQNAQALALSIGDIPFQVTANLHLGGACLGVGDYREAQESLLEVVRLLKGGLSEERFGLPGFPGVLARSYLTWVFGDRGKFEEGIAHGREGIRLAEELGHPYSLTHACSYLAHLHITKGNLGDAVRLIERGLAVARKWNITVFSMGHPGSLGYVYVLLGRLADGIPLIEETMSAFESMGHRIAHSFFLVPLGEAYVLADRLDDALGMAERALTFARDGGRRPYEAWALRLLGEVTARRDAPEEADNHYRDALVVAEKLGMRPLAAHCHLCLGRLYRRTGSREQARKHVATATTMYRNMGMAHWLVQADAEMHQLQ